MNDFTILADKFLVAMPSLEDPDFFHSVVYICEHSEEGAMGIIVNHPLDLPSSELLTHMGIETTEQSLDLLPVFAGGPQQQEHGFVLHSASELEWQAQLKVSDETYITTSRDILVDIGQGHGPDNFIIALGFASWEAGQLEEELTENCWLITPSSTQIMFNIPHDSRWRAAASRMGIDFNTMTNDLGHA